jgi:ERCC4-type nuclease
MPEFPAVVTIDTREQQPYGFRSIKADAMEGVGLLRVKTTRATLRQGDYSLEGFEDRIAIERKSAEDLFRTLGQGRKRFERELIRLSAYPFAAVVVESEWSQLLQCPPAFSKLSPKSVFRSVIAWQQRYSGIHWVLCPGRSFAEAATFRILDRFWKDWKNEVTNKCTNQKGKS